MAHTFAYLEIWVTTRHTQHAPFTRKGIGAEPTFCLAVTAVVAESPPADHVQHACRRVPTKSLGGKGCGAAVLPVLLDTWIFHFAIVIMHPFTQSTGG